MEKKIKVYLGGKITPRGWRQKIIDIRSDYFYSCYYDRDDKRSVEKLKKAVVPFNEYVDITGPFFLACDHSCYHGANSHGLGAGRMTCSGGSGFKESDVVEICTTQIKRSDIFIAYIDDETCYGTLFELGVAKALGKKIATIFSNDTLEREMWFIAENSDYCINLDNDKLALKMFPQYADDEMLPVVVDIAKRLKE